MKYELKSMSQLLQAMDCQTEKALTRKVHYAQNSLSVMKWRGYYTSHFVLACARINPEVMSLFTEVK